MMECIHSKPTEFGDLDSKINVRRRTKMQALLRAQHIVQASGYLVRGKYGRISKSA
jgi:hypothetical protein